MEETQPTEPQIIEEQKSEIIEEQKSEITEEQTPEIIEEQPSEIIEEQPSEIIEEQKSEITDEQTPEIMEEQTPVIIDEQSPEIIIEQPPKVIQNSDYLAKANIEWVKDIEYQPPNQYEKDMLKGTLTPEQLLENEMSEEQKQIVKINDIKVKIKVVSLNIMGENPIQNTSLFSSLKKKTLLDTMNSIYENVYLVDEQKLTEMFNVVCQTKVFGDNCDYTSYPIYT